MSLKNVANILSILISVLVLNLACTDSKPVEGAYHNQSRQFQLKDLEVLEIKRKEGIIKLWIMDTESKREEGMMFLHDHEVAENEGMLFVFAESKERGFWMKNTYLPLELAYMDERGQVFQIEDLKPLNLKPVQSIKPFLYALEMRAGSFKKYNIQKNQIIPHIASFRLKKT